MSAISGKIRLVPWKREKCPESMMTSQPSQPSPDYAGKNPCRHPRVQIVTRDEDSEYVECVECGDIFESSEFKDMALEDNKDSDDA